MKREQVIEWAKQAGFKVTPYTGGKKAGKESVFDFGDVDMLHELKRFAALVAAAEREACAELMEQQHAWVSNVAASALIRARGNGGGA